MSSNKSRMRLKMGSACRSFNRPYQHPQPRRSCRTSAVCGSSRVQRSDNVRVAPSMKFGVFDHLDRNDLPLNEFYEQRLQIVEAYDRGGFYSYHTAEHHATPLGLAASPSVFLAAVAQRTQQLRFGPLVYTLPLHHPLRVVEEICMLDQLGRGRFDLGVGRGISPIETAYFGIDPAHRQKMFLEGLQILQQALTQPTLTFHGQFYDYTNVPMELAPFQNPHPPCWSGAGSPEGGEAAGRSWFNLVSNALTSQVRAITDR